jgi:hypothetical protein
MKVRPIDANKLREEIMTENYDNDTINNFLDLVDFAPTLDYEPVVHAHWIQKGFDCKCSNCGSFNGAFGVKYCQDCGAKMDEEVQSNANNNS